MRVNLGEIPEEGRTYIWNTKTAELNSLLSDLVGKLPHHAEFFIKPLNSRDYEFNGFIKTEMPEACSRCGEDFDLKVDEKFKGILIPRQTDTRTGHYAKVNHVSEALEEGPQVAEYDGGVFEMGEYLHEIVALSAPFNPVAPEDAQGNCTICKIPVKNCVFSYDEVMPEEKPESPFSVLKNVKLN